MKKEAEALRALIDRCQDRLGAVSDGGCYVDTDDMETWLSDVFDNLDLVLVDPVDMTEEDYVRIT